MSSAYRVRVFYVVFYLHNTLSVDDIFILSILLKLICRNSGFRRKPVPRPRPFNTTYIPGYEEKANRKTVRVRPGISKDDRMQRGKDWDTSVLLNHGAYKNLKTMIIL